MSENDYIAEYVKEKRPEILGTVDFMVWKLTRILSSAVDSFIESFNKLNPEETKKFVDDARARGLYDEEDCDWDDEWGEDEE